MRCVFISLPATGIPLPATLLSVLTQLCHRFGEYLRSSMIKEYYPFYIAYDDLKKSLKTDLVEPASENANHARKEWSEDDETHFVSLLESELEKVFLFQKRKSEEIVERIQDSELEVSDVVSRLDGSIETRRQSTRTARPTPTDADFLMLEQVLSDIIADVHDLAKFTQLNYTGFQKIIKKHDVRVRNLDFGCDTANPPYRKKQNGISSRFSLLASMPSPSSRTTTTLSWLNYRSCMTSSELRVTQ